MAGVFQPLVFQVGVFQMFDGMPPDPPVTSFGSIEAAFAVHTKPQQRKLPIRVRRHLLKQIEAQKIADRKTKALIASIRRQMVVPVDSSVGIA